MGIRLFRFTVNMPGSLFLRVRGFRFVTFSQEALGPQARGLIVSETLIYFDRMIPSPSGRSLPGAVQGHGAVMRLNVAVEQSTIGFSQDAQVFLR